MKNKPSITFNYLNDEWLSCKLGELGFFKNGMNFDKSAMGHGYPFINLQDIFGKNKLEEEKLGLAKSNIKQREEYNLLKGDILFIRSSVKPEGVGEEVLMDKSLENTTFSGFIIRFRFTSIVDHEFKRIMFKTRKFRNQVIENATSSANTNINQVSLQKITLNIPSLEEQKRIGIFFKHLDEVISLHQQELDALKQTKKGFLQKMFPKNEATIPEIRFPEFKGNWRLTTLGEIAEIVRGASPRPIQNPKWFDDTSEVGWLRIADVTEQNGRIHRLEQRLSVDGQSKTRVLTKPHLMLSIAATVGKPVINYVSTGVHDGFLIFKNPQFDIEFMFQWLEMFRLKWSKYGQPGSQVNLNSELVRNQILYLPDIKEQIKISRFFEQIDQVILLKEKELEALKKTKQGFLQKMFV